MSTHACLAYETKKGWFTIYSHGDGYPSCTGAQLLRCYSKREDFMKLVDMGDMSWPDPSQTYSNWEHCKTLGWSKEYFDSQLNGVKTRFFKTFDELKKYADSSMSADYIYFMSLKHKSIYVSVYRSPHEFTPAIRLRLTVTKDDIEDSSKYLENAKMLMDVLNRK